MKKIALFPILLMFIVTFSPAQTASDALRFSQITYGGTARFLGTAGAFGAIGADISTLATNPAGIGLYRSSEVTFSPSLYLNFNTANYLGTKSERNNVNFGFNNIGVVFNFYNAKKNTSKGLKSLNFGIGINRQNDFNERVDIQGYNHSSSMLNAFTNTLNEGSDINPNEVSYYYPFDIGLAYDCQLIYYDSLLGKYQNDMPNGGVFQSQQFHNYGSMNELDLSFGGNISDQLFFGLTIGIPTIRFYHASRYYEEDTGDSIPFFQSFLFDYNYSSQGTGVNVKFGLIYRPANWLRIGGAIHTPTWYPSMVDYYSSSMNASYDSALFPPGFRSPVFYSPSGTYNYQMMTPFRAFGSVAFFIGKYGFISGEYEYIDYNQARFKASNDPFTDVNSEIKNSYKSPVNIKIGTEWRIYNFKLRGGFAYVGGADYAGDNGTRYTISGGMGYYNKRFFVDIAYQWSKHESRYYPYDPSLVSPADLNFLTHMVTSTFGIRF